MRIACIAPLVESVPPTLYGGTERVVAWIVDELARRGHDVTLFASGDSRVRARLVAGSPRAMRLAGVADPTLPTLLMLADVFRRAGEFDVIHSHVDWLAYPFASLVRTPVVHTLHGRLDLPELPDVYARHPELDLVSISYAQRAPLPRVRFHATVYHGLPRDLLRPGPGRGGYAVFLGRMSPEKGPVLAIEAARRAGVPLVMAAKVDRADREHFEREVRPRLDGPGVEFIGEVSDREKTKLLGDATALLAPIDWPEPFGLVYIEALACGTPVITRHRGSAPELIEHGRTGFLADDVDALAHALRAARELDRSACRAEFERRFVVERMVDDYERVYRELRTDARLRRAGEATIGS